MKKLKIKEMENTASQIAHNNNYDDLQITNSVTGIVISPLPLCSYLILSLSKIK